MMAKEIRTIINMASSPYVNYKNHK